MKQLILASGSPRRRELLGLFGIPFVVRAADIDETMDPAQSPAHEVAQVSRRKAMAVERGPEDVVIAADTIVVCQGKILGKPHSREEAVSMLHLLSGREHQVMTGCTVLWEGGQETFTEVTTLTFRPLSDGEIQRYVDSGEPMDKAGSPIWNLGNWRDKAGGYGIQEPFGAMAIESISGDYYNVVGLPVCRLYQVLKEFNIV